MRECVENPWRGNVRSLKAAIEQAVILSAGSEITAAELLGSVAEQGALRVTGVAGRADDGGQHPVPARATGIAAD